VLGWAPNKLDDHWVVIYEFPATIHVRGRTWQHFTFPPLVPSEKEIYQFQVQQTAVRSLDRGASRPAVGIVACEDGPLTDGNLIVGATQVVDRDLVYAASTASRYERFRMRANQLLPRGLRTEPLQLAVLALYNMAMALLAYDLTIRVADEL